MEKGVNQYWTPEMEAYCNLLIDNATSFAQRFMATAIRNTLKYHHRTKESKKAWAKLQLTLATATDDDLKELAELQHKLLGDSPLDEKLEDLIKTREEIRARGIPRELIGGRNGNATKLC